MKKLIVLSALFFSGIMFASAQDAKPADKKENGKETVIAKHNCSKPEGSGCCSKKTSSAQAAKKSGKKACSAESGKKSCCSKKTEATKKEE